MKELLFKVIFGFIITMIILYFIILPDSIIPSFGENNKKPLEVIIELPEKWILPDSVNLAVGIDYIDTLWIGEMTNSGFYFMKGVEALPGFEAVCIVGDTLIFKIPWKFETTISY